LFNAIPKRLLIAVFGTGFGSVFPGLKRVADNLCGPAEAALFIVALGLAPDQHSEFSHHKPPLKACFRERLPFHPPKTIGEAHRKYLLHRSTFLLSDSPHEFLMNAAQVRRKMRPSCDAASYRDGGFEDRHHVSNRTRIVPRPTCQ
jgi:hypothetical protein